MLNYNITCNACHVTFSMTEESLLDSSSLVCPHCQKKMPSNELNHLKMTFDIVKTIPISMFPLPIHKILILIRSLSLHLFFL